MHSLETTVEIRVLARRGRTIKGIARELGVSRNTVRKYLRREEAPSYGPRSPRPTKLDAFKDYLLERIANAKPHWIPAVVLHRELVALGYVGGLTQLKLFINAHKPRLVEEPLIRFETEPGLQMQGDFIVFRRGVDRLSAFVATLGFSRATFVHFVTNERLETLLDCLEHAFDYFGGVPQHVLLDNMKTAVLDRDAYGRGVHRYHPALLALANELGFAIRLCRPYRAKTKGKVERFNGYLRHSFYVPLAAKFKASGLVVDAASANLEVGRWLRDVANVRKHATLNERPIDRLVLERLRLLPYRTRVLAPPLEPTRVPIPIESLQHPLSTYQALIT
jgi:transposase